MGAVLGAAIDFFHAMLMAAWIVGLPLLFTSRWPRVARIYAFYAIGFIVVNQISSAILGECFLTTISRMCWQHSAGASVSGEWFTVRIAEAVFRLTPSHRAIKLVSEALIFFTAIGVAVHSVSTPIRARRSL